ncbi:putative serine carboxypeptidase CPVL [Halotydeus destructor]|nr:putative serine carboxypeptidase CPVL [Halotydeus destructor]
MRLIVLIAVLACTIGQSWGARFEKGFRFDNNQVPTPGDDVGDRLFLTPYIEAGQLDVARKLATVGQLPNAPEVLSYSGYLTVNKTDNSNLFFWFFPNQLKTAPILLWLQGGPGAPSMFAIFNENGPYVVQKNWKSDPVLLREYAWTNYYHVIYIDQPVNTGYSFTDNPAGLATTEEEVARDLFEALQQFFTLFPEYQTTDFYITGESYAGKYVPAIGYKIHTEGAASKMNLKGLAIGDGWTDPMRMKPHISTTSKTKVLKLIEQGDYVAAGAIFDPLLGGDESGYPTYFTNKTGSTNYYNFLLTEEPEEFSYASNYIVSDPVRKAIHVGSQAYGGGQDVGVALNADIMKSAKPWLEELSNHYRVLLYNGQLDIICAPVTTENMILNMNWSGAEAFRTVPKQVWKVSPKDPEVAGYVRNVGDFFHVIIRDAGHMVPSDQPRAALAMLNNFIQNKFTYEN